MLGLSRILERRLRPDGWQGCLGGALVLGLLAGAGLALPAWAASGEAVPIPYRVRFVGVDDARVMREFKRVSGMLALKRQRPLSELQLRRRAERDLPDFLQVLRAHGFYGATVDLELRVERRPVRVRYRVRMGAPYRLRHSVVEPMGGGDGADLALPTAEALGLTPGAPAAARSILEAETHLVAWFQRRGHPFARVVERETQVHHGAEAVDVYYRLDPGPAARFGETQIGGAAGVQHAFLRGKLPWRSGDPYDGDQVVEARRRLVAAGLFASVRVEPAAQALGADAALPMQVVLTERKHRSVTLAGGYHNDEGWRVRAGWEHRNLWQRGERLALSYQVSEISHGGELSLWQPDFYRVDQNLTLRLHQKIEDTDAYRSANVGLLARMDRELARGWVVGGGLGSRYSAVRDIDNREAFWLVYAPLGVNRDRSDDLLDPRRGYKISLETAPYTDVLDVDLTFLKSQVAGAVYQRLNRRWDLDWAGRSTLAALVGAERDAVPADERYYAGGGGSVRGYAYQSVGPLEDETPLGGRSMLLLAHELRWRMTESFGLVVFQDGGAVVTGSALESATEELLWGAGVGLRYFTPVGPLRADVGFPLDRRAGVDESVQYYVSLGQSF